MTTAAKFLMFGIVASIIVGVFDLVLYRVGADLECTTAYAGGRGFSHLFADDRIIDIGSSLAALV